MTWVKVLKILFWIVVIGIIAFIILVMTIFYILGKDLVSEIETHRHVSPDRKLDAVVIEADAGALTTSVMQRLYIVKRGNQPSGKAVAVIDSPVIKNKETNSTKYGVIVQWKSPSELVVQYSDAKHIYLDHSMVEVNDKKSHIELDEMK
jgi:hypothetical protein